MIGFTWKEFFDERFKPNLNLDFQFNFGLFSVKRVEPTIPPSSPQTSPPTSLPSTTAPPKLTDILILSTFYSSSLPYLTDVNGKNVSLESFEFDRKTEVKNSCSLTWKGEHYVFGGETFRRQVSQGGVGIELCFWFLYFSFYFGSLEKWEVIHLMNQETVSFFENQS